MTNERVYTDTDEPVESAYPEGLETAWAAGFVDEEGKPILDDDFPTPDDEDWDEDWDEEFEDEEYE